MSTDNRSDAIEDLRRGLFDADWYARTYPDVALTGLDPTEHYVRFGARLGRPPNGSSRREARTSSHGTGRKGPVVGNVDDVSGNFIVGWAIRKKATGSPVRLKVRVHGVDLGEFAAAKRRPDLDRIASHYDGGGFEIPVPYAKTNDTPVEIQITEAETSIQIGESPLRMKARRVPSSPARVIRNLLEAHAGRDVAILVPIFNAFEELQRCLDALTAHTTHDAQLILIDDASTDARVAPLLQGYAERPRVEVMSNPENLGFTRTVNRGIRSAGGADVVLLNSDARVTPRWLENLRMAAYCDFKVGTVTPFSDNAGAFSAPELGESNEIPAGLTPDAYARVVSHSSLGLMPAVPTGNGFCMYVRRACLDDVGLFDEAAFPRGYGEENDFCMRALRAGWRHLIDDRTLVFHSRSASFGSEKQRLARDGRAIIDARYPEYERLIEVFHSDGKLLSARHALRRACSGTSENAPDGRPRFLFVIATQTGGTPRTNQDLMRGVADEIEPWLLRCDAVEMTLSRLEGEEFRVIESCPLSEPVDAVSHRSSEYDDVLTGWIRSFAFELVHVRHFAWHSLGLFSVCTVLRVPVIFSFHDFYALCPTVNLLDAELEYCAGSCTRSRVECQVDLWPEGALPPLKHNWINRWQSLMRESLKLCAAFVTTSEHVRQTVLARYPELGEAEFSIIPHGRQFVRMRDHSELPPKDGVVRILVPGNINPKKGSEFVRQLTIATNNADSSSISSAMPLPSCRVSES